MPTPSEALAVAVLRLRMTMTDAQVKAIEAVLAKGDRVELIPVKDGVKVIHIKRKEVKSEQ